MKIKFALLLLVVSSVAFGSIENARIVHSASLSQAMKSGEWVAYEVPSSGRFVLCCFEANCQLGHRGGSSFNTRDSGHFARIAHATMIVAIGPDREIELYSGGCPLDAGGKTVHVVDNVSADESLRLLEGMVGADRHHGALAAIAMHDSPKAVQILESFTAAGNDRKLRGDAVFWLAQAGGQRGFEVARQMTDDPDSQIRKKAVFALTQSPEPGVFDALASIVRHHPDADTRAEAVFWLGQHGRERALPVLRERIEQESNAHVREKAIFAIGQVPGDEATQTLIRLAREHRDAHVRKQALFWLGQKAEAKIGSVMRDAAEHDPESSVREAAVFAISQRPRDEAIPQLVELARTNRDPAVRKKAVFWLAQMDDPRALAAIERILLK